MENDKREMWVAECKVCCWRFSSPYSSRVNVKADEHQQQTGHQTKVDIELQ